MVILVDNSHIFINLKKRDISSIFMQKEEQLIGYCGLYCGDCHGFTGKIPDLARDLRKELREIKYDKFAAFISKYSFGKDFKNYDECCKVLGAMVKFRCKKGCINGGGALLFAIFANVVRKKTLKVVGNAKNLRHAKNLTF